ncbi:MAG: NAD metabolism ATPase/kinase [Flavobacteriaceae bacterium]|nr:MAG: NAD metabolism ATPase/kinase [Flavobacteriaceae bacterium]
MTNFSEDDLLQLLSKGISKEKVLQQVVTFKEGIPFVRLEKAAVISEGISKFSKTEEEELIQKFEASLEGLSLLKFVPASGAASRMFKALFNFLETYDPSNEMLDAYIKRTGDKDIETFFDGYKNFAFYDLIQNSIKGKGASKDEEQYFFVKKMMLEDGYNYGFYPKGLLPFHNYGEYSATPFEEHLKEASAYAKADGVANLHFTISEQHGKMFNEEFNKVGQRVSQSTETSFKVGYSFQKPSTDTIAVTMDNEFFRNSDSSLLFRPGGHGALIENLDEQDADIIFIKNIDNVVVPEFAKEVGKSKKVLAGLLVEVQQQAFSYAALLDMVEITAEQLNAIKDFLENDLNVRFSDNFSNFSIGEQIEVLKDKINRPIRVCGMVKNEGEPGGGPFWIKDRNGRISLQIIESAQVDITNESQLNIFKNSTHFNPVDLVCGVKDFNGEKYNLSNFVDHQQGFITEKTKEGKNLKAMELPGLWNGAMAFWNTIFVEVPLITFNPVKTVNDLLKPAHQKK